MKIDIEYCTLEVAKFDNKTGKKIKDYKKRDVYRIELPFGIIDIYSGPMRHFYKKIKKLMDAG